MGLSRRLLYLTISTIFMVLVVTISFYWSWKQINLSLERDEYAKKVEQQVFLLQKNTLLEPISIISPNSQWLKNHAALSEVLTNVPELAPAQQSIQNSLVAQNRSLGILYRQLQRLSIQHQDSKIQKHLTDRLLVQIESIWEDARKLAAMSTQEIRHTIARDLFIVLIVLLFAVVILGVGASSLNRFIVTALKQLQTGVEKISAGKYETVEFDPRASEFQMVANKFNEMSQQLKKSTVTREVLQQIVDERTAVLKEIALSDPLTQIANRRALFERGIMEFNRARRHDISFSLLIIDCDYFKKINDKFGHLIGDSMLIHLCRNFERNIREVDFLARYGGEEFVILLPHCDASGAMEKAKVIQDAVAQHPLYKDDLQIEVTISLGIAELNDKHMSFERLLKDADDALLVAKEKGRNRVELHKTSG